MPQENPPYMVISSRDPMSIATFVEVIAEINFSLVKLRELANSTNFDNESERKRYHDNVSHLKCFYERAERIALDAKTN